MVEPRPLKKVPFEHNKVLAGVCAGISYACGVNVWIIRLLCIVALFVILPGIVISYIIAAIILPEWDELPEDYSERTGD